MDVSEKKRRPPKNDYATTEELLIAIDEMESKMKPEWDTYVKKEMLLRKSETVANRHSAALALMVLGLIVYLAIFFNDISPYNFTDMNRWKTYLILFVVFTIVVPVLYAVLFKLIQIIHLHRINKKLAQIELTLQDLYDSYGECPIGYKYTMPSTIHEIESMLRDGRADTVKEAIKEYIQDERNDQLMQYQTLIERNTKQTAIATTATAFFTWRTSHWAKAAATKDK